MMRSVAILLGLTALAAAHAAELNPVRTQPVQPSHTSVQRIIVKLRAHGAERRLASDVEPTAALATRARLALRAARQISGDLHVMEVEPAAGETTAALLARLREDPAVVYAEPDERRYPLAVPDDPLFDGQWYEKNVEPSAVDAVHAWDVTKGSDGVVIAVIDTGVRYDHPDLGRAPLGRLLPGYDFISADPGGGALVANDGDGRDDDPSDPGDWVSQADVSLPLFNTCGVDDSSWHGTRVAGIVGAITDNATGVAGITWNTWILPARVLGKCGGYDSDIIAAMLWSAGIRVNGVPDNLYPAKVENISLGSVGGACPFSYQDAISQIKARGVLVVASAGNESGPVGVPARCPGVAAIAGLRHVGSKVGFSSFGPEVALGAPGGNCVNTGPGEPCLYSIDTTTNTGTTVPQNDIYTDQFNFNVGTSFSAPIVSAIAGLMASVNGNLNSSQLILRLQESANPFPNTPAATCPPPDPNVPECDCTTATCGAGMADARKAVEAALRPIAAIATTGAVAPGQDVVLDATGSAAACGRTLATFAWEVVTGTGVISDGADTDTATVVAPASGSYTVRLTVTDDAGAQDTANIVILPTSTSTSAPADAGDTACPASIDVPDPPIDVPATIRVGEDLRTDVTFQLGADPIAPTDVSVTIPSTAIAEISPDFGGAGGASVVVAGVEDTEMHTVSVYGIAQGATTLAISAPGYTAAEVRIHVDPSGFVLDTGSFSTASNAANRAIRVEAARLTAGSLAYAETQTLRPGMTADVAIDSSDPAVGTLAIDTLHFVENTSAFETQFDPLAAGTTTLSIQTPAGFETPGTGQSIVATVTDPASGSGGNGGGGGGGGADWLLGAALLAAGCRLRGRPSRLHA